MGEECAAEYLEKQGMHIIEYNFRSRQGEIDIIGYHNNYLVFVEVKSRNNSTRGRPEWAVGITKQKKICKVADYYRFINQLSSSTPVRYDVVAIYKEEIQWYQNAFPHTYDRH